jgi:hypothetical protein
MRVQDLREKPPFSILSGFLPFVRAYQDSQDCSPPGRGPSTRTETMSDWTTRVLPEYTRPYGVEEVHDVWFVPNGWPGKGPAISLLVPECELQFIPLASDGELLAFINRPRFNKNVKSWLRYACKLATDHRACLFVACDTADEVERAAKRATKWLPHHQRAALERMYDFASRVKEKLS